MDRLSDGDCLNVQIQRIMKKHFTGYNMSLYIFLEKTNTLNKDLGSQLYDKTDDAAALKQLKTVGHKYCYANKIIEVTDHRISSDGSRKKLLWIMAGDVESTANLILAKIILNELVPKFNEMVMFEGLMCVSDSCSYDVCFNANLKKYFYAKISKKEWILHKYVRKIIKKYKLPRYDAFIQLSAMFYEKRSIETKLYFSQNSIPLDLKDAVYFQTKKKKFKLIKFKPKKIRVVRKLMEISGEKYGLWIKLPKLRIEGSIKDEDYKRLAKNTKDSTHTNTVCIKFERPFVWSICAGNGEEIFRFREGKYIIPTLQPQKDKFAKLENLISYGKMKNIAEEKIEVIQAIIQETALRCKHGTSMVFMNSDEIDLELDERLAKFKRAFKVENISLQEADKDMIQGITAIDGAIFCDLSGNCCAIGVIVDGETIVEGDYGRGARFNSLNNYVQVYKEKHKDSICFAAVISEDGMVDIIT